MMNPPLVLKDGALWCVFGTPGADNQVQINLQVLTAMIDFGLDPQQAAEMPRWTSNVPGQYANWPHDGEDALTLERLLSGGKCAASLRAAVTRSRASATSTARAVSRSSAATRRAAYCSPVPTRAATAGLSRGRVDGIIVSRPA
jgi:gamma-glutamyltranspeptidase